MHADVHWGLGYAKDFLDDCLVEGSMQLHKAVIAYRWRAGCGREVEPRRRDAPAARCWTFRRICQLHSIFCRLEKFTNFFHFVHRVAAGLENGNVLQNVAPVLKRRFSFQGEKTF
jgi:hypothetical protein